MLKAVCYLRVAKSARGFVFNATTKPSTVPLGGGYADPPLVTRQFKLVLNLSDAAFNALDGSVEIDVPDELLQEVVLQAEAQEIAS